MRQDALTCPACGAEFTVRERLEEEQPEDQSERTPDARHDQATCPNCGAPVGRPDDGDHVIDV
ncbi:MAG: hypothetical protein WD830_05130 [Chloroflexota bacterium]